MHTLAALGLHFIGQALGFRSDSFELSIEARSVSSPTRSGDRKVEISERLAFAYDDPTQADKVVLMKLDRSRG